MYKSKYYTNPQIDERLLQGYYNDFVEAGFKGTKEDFFKFVLSISNKVDREEGKGLSSNDFTDELKAKLDEFKSVTKVSELENDAKYQTEDDVKSAINDLIGGASDALNTLKELADALDNDPNFATTVTNKLSDVQTRLSEEIVRAKEVENELKASITKLKDDEDQRARDEVTQLENLRSQLQDSINKIEPKLENLSDDLNEAKVQFKQDLVDFKLDLHKEVDEESNRANTAEQALSTRITELGNQHALDKSELENKISSEAQIRESKDNEILQSLNAEKSDRASSEERILDKIQSENTSRIEADKVLEDKLQAQIVQSATELNGDITEETAARKVADAELGTQISNEVENRKNADELLEHKIDDLGDKIEDTKSSLADKLDAEISARKEADNGKVDKESGKGLSTNDFDNDLKKKLEKIEDNANYITKVSELINDLNFQTQDQVEEYIDKLIGGAPDALNTLKELADALGDDNNFASTISNKITALAEQINQEVHAREQSDQTIQTGYERADQFLQGKIDDIKEDLDQEVSDRKEVIIEIKALYQEIKTECKASVEKLQTQLDTIKEAYQDTYNDLKAQISKNTSAIQDNLELIQNIEKTLTDVNTGINSVIATERSERIAADNRLENLIDSAVYSLNETIEEVEDKLTKSISKETTDRKEADQTLQSNIDKVVQDLANESSTRQSQDEAIQNSLQEETNQRTQSDTTLDGKISQETTTRSQEDAKLQSAIEKEVQDREQAISDEAQARELADSGLRENITSLTSSISQESTDRAQADNQLQTNIDNEKTAREQADQTLQSNIENEAALRATEDKKLKDEIGTKQDNITVGEGLKLENNHLSITLDTTLYKVVDVLPDRPAEGDENKLHLVPVHFEDTTKNHFKEYIWVNDSYWEEMGDFSPEIDLEGYLSYGNTRLNAEPDAGGIVENGGRNRIFFYLDNGSNSYNPKTSEDNIQIEKSNLIDRGLSIFLKKRFQTLGPWIESPGLYKIGFNQEGIIHSYSEITVDDIKNLDPNDKFLQDSDIEEPSEQEVIELFNSVFNDDSE